jgi:hypothetical protein
LGGGGRAARGVVGDDRALTAALFPDALHFRFVLRVHPAYIFWIITGLQELGMLAREQKLFAHFSKASAAKFLVEQFEYGGHCHPHL